MTVAVPSSHARALEQALLGLFVGTATAVYVNVVPPAPTYPYVVLFADSPDVEHDSLGALGEHATFHPTVHLVGVSSQMMFGLLDRFTGLFDIELPVDGRLIEVHTMSSSPVSRDDDVPDRVVLMSRQLLRLESYAA